MRVSGVVLLEPGHPQLADAVLRVALLDVTEQDAPSVPLAETVIAGVAHRAGEERAVPFHLETDPATDETLPASADLTVAAHLRPAPETVARETSTRQGDLVTTASILVPSSGADGVVVRVRLV